MRRYYMTVNNLPENPDGPPPSPIIRTYVTYGKCQKNQAEHIGGHAVDGCGEFMPSGEEGTPASRTCAACGCHKSYHQIEVHTVIMWNNGPPPPPPSDAEGA